MGLSLLRPLEDLISPKGNLPILLAAPTGQAARRMNELTGLPSPSHTPPFRNDGDDDAVIWKLSGCWLYHCWQFSMVDTWLANQLFSNISSNDEISWAMAISYRLSSPGQVLAGLYIPWFHELVCYRQESTIVTLAESDSTGHLASWFHPEKSWPFLL